MFFKFQTRIRRRKWPVDSHIGRAGPEGGGHCLMIPHTSMDIKSYAVYYISYLCIRSLNSCNHWSIHSWCIWFNYLHNSFHHERIILSALIYSHIFTLVLPRTRLRGTVGVGRGGHELIGKQEQSLENKNKYCLRRQKRESCQMLTSRVLFLTHTLLVPVTQCTSGFFTLPFYLII